MTWIDLGNPSPKIEPDPYLPFCWASRVVEYLEVPDSFPDKALSDILQVRRTKRKFRAVDPANLASLLWQTARSQDSFGSALGFPLSFRPVPSAGAIHPIHILINRYQDSKWFRYLSDSHALAEVVQTGDVLDGVRKDLSPILDVGEGTILLFVAEPGKSAAKYDHANSLVWRDAGVLLGYLSLVAEALDLHFCPVGITGDNWVRGLSKQGLLAGVGLAVIG